MTSTDPTPRTALRARPVIAPALLNLLVASYLMLVMNGTYWDRVTDAFDGRPLALTLFALAVWALMALVVNLLAVRRAQRPVLAGLVVLAAVTSWYQDRLGVTIDREMIQNVFATTTNEGKHLITPAFLGHVALYGLPGLALVFWPQIRRRGLIRATLGWAGISALLAASVVGFLMLDLRELSATLRARKDIMASVQPLAPLGGTLRYAKMMFGARDVVAAPYGTDAVKGPRLAAVKKPVLFVIVAGETARAQNWSLGGYERDTNPELARRDIVYYSDVTSCGTATATSLPCMFSHLTRDDYSYQAGLASENLLDVLTHAGVKVEWWDNNTGDKDIAKRLPRHMMSAEDDAAACARGECIDQVFLPRLKKVEETMTEDTVIVLHQIGSHGPSYWLRYPEDRETFKPACHSPELGDCTTDEIVNAYDNTILETDRFLSQVIDQLGASGRVTPAMIYVSDHGESLGEGGLYLHGAPWAFAPVQQTHVPMVLWLSPAFREAMGMDTACLAAAAGGPASHDNLFATVLGLMDIQTTVRDDALDLSSACRKAQS